MIILERLNVEGVEAIYTMTRSPEIQKMSLHEGEIIPIGAYLMYEDKKADGTSMTIVSIKDADTGEVFATNSPTFAAEFSYIIDMCHDAGVEVGAIKIVGGTSKAGRHFITCSYVSIEK